MGERGVALRAFMCCLDVGDRREKEDLEINLRIVYFSLTGVRNRGRGTDLRGRQVQWENSELEVSVGYSGSDV